MSLVILLFAAAAPFLTWIVELVFPYPYLVEELIKTVLVFFILDLPNKSTKIKFVVYSGGLFAFSESVFYLFNIYLVGNLQTLFFRLILTTGLHVITFLVILLPGLKNKRFILVGTLLAVFLHYFYNRFVSSINL